MRMLSKTAPLAGLMMIGWALATPATAAPTALPAGPLASYADTLGAGSSEARHGQRCWRECHGPWWRRRCVTHCAPVHPPRHVPPPHWRWRH